MVVSDLPVERSTSRVTSPPSTASTAGTPTTRTSRPCSTRTADQLDNLVRIARTCQQVGTFALIAEQAGPELTTEELRRGCRHDRRVRRSRCCRSASLCADKWDANDVVTLFHVGRRAGRLRRRRQHRHWLTARTVGGSVARIGSLPGRRRHRRRRRPDADRQPRPSDYELLPGAGDDARRRRAEPSRRSRRRRGPSRS